MFEFHIHADAIRAFFCIFFSINVPLSDNENSRFVWYAEVGLVMKPQHQTLIGIYLQSNYFLLSLHKFLYFLNFRWFTQSLFFLKKDR